MKTRNPIAGNAWRYNKRQVIPNKRKQYRDQEDEYLLPEDYEEEEDNDD